VTTIPYVKGAALLHVLERAVGRERFDRYLRSWFDRHAFTSVTSEDFIQDVSRHLLDDKSTVDTRISVERWVYGSGLPADATPVTSAPFEEVDLRALAFANGAPAEALGAANWTTQEWRHFLTSLPMPLSVEQMVDLDRTYQLTAVQNVEVLAPWLRLAVRHGYEPAAHALERVLMEQGRRKFLEPLYRELMTSEEGSEKARRIYARARPRYHATTRMTLDPIVAP
jgi:hypothetical protein